MGELKEQSRIKYVWHGVVAIKDIAVLILGRWIAAIMPRDSKKVLFGAWWGQQFSDNPKYFMKYLIELDQGFKCYWVGNEEIRSQVESCPGVRFVRKGSWIVRWHILTAKWAMFNIGFDCDITTIPTYGKIQLLSFWHGTAFKGAVHRDYVAPAFPLSGAGFARGLKNLRDKLFYDGRTLMCKSSFSSRRMIEIMPHEVPWAFSVENSINAGTAKIEFLIRNRDNVQLQAMLKQKYSRILGIPVDKKWYLYMPTWRNGLALNFTFTTSAILPELQDVLKNQNAVLIEKQHPQVIRALNINAWQQGDIYVVSNSTMSEIDTQELLLCAERLISDYSSCLFDFECMNRPVIHYAYDYDAFKRNDRGVEYELADIAAGPVVKTEEELLRVMQMSDDDIIRQKGPHFNLPIDGETGNSCEMFCRWVGMVS